MARLRELLEDAVGSAEPPFGPADIERRARRRGQRRQTRAAIAAITAVVLVVASVVVIAERHHATNRVVTAETEPPSTPPSTTPKQKAIFSTPTATTLIFDDGYDGIALLDLDHSTLTRRVITGQRAGDQPYRLFRVADRLIVGWGQIWAVPLSGAAPYKVGDATVAIPATEPDLVWLYDYPGEVPARQQPITFADSRRTNSHLFEGPTLAGGGGPIIGVAKQLAYQTSDGIKIWDATRGGRVALSLGSGNATVGDSAGAILSWCNDRCRTLHFTDVDTGNDTAVPLPNGVTAVDMGRSHFSPNSNLLAVPMASGVVLADIGGHRATLVIDDARFGAYPNITWSPAGDQLYVASGNMLGRYDVASGKFDVVKLDQTLGGAFVSAQNEEVHALVTAPTALPTDCTSPPVGRPRAYEHACKISVTAQP
jgi:hypothetical protein